MSKGSYPYPEDEFDAAPTQDAPVGVHRAPRSWWSRWWPFVAVVVVVPALAVGLVTWASSWDGNLTLPGTSTEQDAQTTAATASADETATDTASDPAAEPTEEAPAATEEPSVVAEPDLAASISVLNAARVSGLAAGVASDLEDAGFTAVTTGNTSAGGRTTSTVYYASVDLQVTAQKVADTLGITTVTESADDAGDGITVLLLSDFTG